MSRTKWIISAVFVVVAISGVAVYAKLHAKPADELSPEKLKALAAADPSKLFDKMRETMERKDLTDEQRRQAGQNVREAMESQMRVRVDEYFSAKSEEDKNSVLDKHIEEMQKRMKEMEGRRKEWEAKRKEAEAKGEKPEDRREQWQRMQGSMTQEERKQRAETRNPDDMARNMAYFAAMRQRAEQRGIQMPFGPGRWGGGGGGGGGDRGPRP